jgi:hypothetical protein
VTAAPVAVFGRLPCDRDRDVEGMACRLCSRGRRLPLVNPASCAGAADPCCLPAVPSFRGALLSGAWGWLCHTNVRPWSKVYRAFGLRGFWRKGFFDLILSSAYPDTAPIMLHIVGTKAVARKMCAGAGIGFVGPPQSAGAQGLWMKLPLTPALPTAPPLRQRFGPRSAPPLSAWP